MRQEVIQKAPEWAKKQKPNLTGIPTQMKLDFEHRSGLSFDDVRVHYNSDKPRKIGALAYTQIPQVHIGPGQERHLRHELGHVVQQKRGIVRPTTWINGLPVNDSPELEHSASELSLPIECVSRYSSVNGTQSTIQMLACNSPWVRGSASENRQRIVSIKANPSDKRPISIVCRSLNGHTNLTYFDTNELKDTRTFFRFQHEWIDTYQKQCYRQRELNDKFELLQATLASATNMGEDAYFLFKKNHGLGDIIFDPKGVDIIKGILYEARLATQITQSHVFSCSRQGSFQQVHYDADDRTVHKEKISYHWQEGELPRCLAFVKFSEEGGQIFACANNEQGFLPKYIHPIMADRIRKLNAGQLRRYLTTNGVGTHAEIYTVNKLLKASDSSDIPPGTKLYIVSPQHDGFKYFGRCAHCHDILASIDPTSLSLAFGEKEVLKEYAEEQRNARGGDRGAARGRGGAVRGRGGAVRGRGGATRGRGGAVRGRGGAAADRGGTT